MQREDDELLVNYLLDGLSESEREEVESRLEADPALADRLESLRACMGDPDCEEEFSPRGLASKTTDSIHGLFDCPAAPASRWSRCDVAALGVASMLVGALLLPALFGNRESARRTVCENNFVSLGKALQKYSVDHRGSFPHIRLGDNAGMYVVSLAEHGHLNRDSLRQVVVCPASQTAELVSRSSISIRVPTYDELRVAHNLMLSRLRKVMGGSTAYSLGFYNKKKVYVEQVRCERRPLLSDAPVCLPNSDVTTNHPRGQNVLFQDGSIRFVVGQRLNPNDFLFRNHDGDLAAGQCWNDSVLAPSWVTPEVATEEVDYNVSVPAN